MPTKQKKLHIFTEAVAVLFAVYVLLNLELVQNPLKKYLMWFMLTTIVLDGYLLIKWIWRK